MSKDYVQALENLFGLVSFQKSLTREQFTRAQEYCDIIETALQRLEHIDNAKPGEAMERLGDLEKYFFNKWKQSYFCEEKPKELDSVATIKQVLLTAQEQNFNYQNIVTPFFDELVELLGINDIDDMLDKIKEQHNVLRILKEKRVDGQLIRIADNVEWYNNNYIYRHEIEYLNRDDVLVYRLTEEEFDTVKRWQQCQ